HRSRRRNLPRLRRRYPDLHRRVPKSLASPRSLWHHQPPDRERKQCISSSPRSASPPLHCSSLSGSVLRTLWSPPDPTATAPTQPHPPNSSRTPSVEAALSTSRRPSPALSTPEVSLTQPPPLPLPSPQPWLSTNSLPEADPALPHSPSPSEVTAPSP